MNTSTPQPRRKATLSARQKLLLHVIDRKVGTTIVQITHLLKPFYPPARPTSQLSVREDIKALITLGLVALAHTGKPRTYIRNRASFTVHPASWIPSSKEGDEIERTRHT